MANENDKWFYVMRVFNMYLNNEITSNEASCYLMNKYGFKNVSFLSDDSLDIELLDGDNIRLYPTKGLKRKMN